MTANTGMYTLQKSQPYCTSIYQVGSNSARDCSGYPAPRVSRGRSKSGKPDPSLLSSGGAGGGRGPPTAECGGRGGRARA
ncbi:MAG: hypothetical protein ACK55U_15450, partial [Bacteroidota bacterium]